VDVDPFAVAVDVALAGAYDPQRSVIHAGVEDLHSWHNPAEHGAVEPGERADRLAVDAELHTVVGVDLVRSLPPLSRSPLPPPPPPSAGADRELTPTPSDRPEAGDGLIAPADPQRGSGLAVRKRMKRRRSRLLPQ
jgi:hypothetical protein